MIKFKTIVKRFLNYCKWTVRRIKNGTGHELPHEHVKVLIIGNGPSAEAIDYNFYSEAGYDFLCVNHFASNSDLFFTIKPKYYCCIDPRIMSKDYLQYEASNKLFFKLNKVDWPMKFICCVGDNPNINNPYISLCKINKAVYDGEVNNFILELYKKNKATCGYQNVIAAALFYTISIRASDVLLIGVESDMHRELVVDENNNIFREYSHFYGKEKKNIVTDGQIKKGELYSYFFWSYKTFYQYSLLAKFATYNGVPIRNLCLNSFIDVFEKVPPQKRARM